jgi:hypothetical protein
MAQKKLHRCSVTAKNIYDEYSGQYDYVIQISCYTEEERNEDLKLLVDLIKSGKL